MDQILERLWLGDFADAEAVTPAQCQLVVSLCEAKPNTAEGVRCFHCPIPDEVFLAPTDWGNLAGGVKNLLYQKKSSVLVHCRLGKSRSPALVAAYLASIGWRDPESALAYVKSRRAIVEVHSETWRGVLEWWGSK